MQQMLDLKAVTIVDMIATLSDQKFYQPDNIDGRWHRTSEDELRPTELPFTIHAVTFS